MKEQLLKLLTIMLGLIASLSSAAEPSNPGTWRYGALGQTTCSQCNEVYWSDPKPINATVLYSPNGSPRGNDYGIFIDASYETGSIYVQTPNCSGPVYKIGNSKEYVMLSLTNWSFTAYKITPTKNRVYGVGPEGSQVYESKIQVISRAAFEDSRTPFYISTFEYWPEQKVVVIAGQYKSGFSSWNGYGIWKIGKPEIIQFDVDGTVSTLIDRRTKTILGARVSTISGKKVFNLEAYSFEGNVVKQYKGISKFVNDFAAAHGGNSDSYVSISSLGSKVSVLAFGSTFTIDSANDRATFVPTPLKGIKIAKVERPAHF